MVNIQEQPERPRMDHILIKALRNHNAYGILHLLNPADPPAGIADHVAVPIQDQAAVDNAKRILQGVTSDGDGVLHIAARLEDVELVRAISERRRDAVDVAAKNKRGETALHCAAATGNVDMINLLIPLAGVDARKRKLLREQNNNGETCLHEAVQYERSNAVRILVQQDMDVYIPDGSLTLAGIHDNEGVSPLYLAATLCQLEIVQFLAPQGGPVGAYPAASYYGPGRKTALHAAVLLDRDLAKHLANWNNRELIEKADESGSTPLHLLASVDDEIIMGLLLEDPSVGYRADNEGSLPIHVAAANGNLSVVKLLDYLRPSCSCSCNFLAQTILHIAVQKRSYFVVDYVCSRQRFTPIYNTRDTDGNTALHLAVLQGDDMIFCRLIRTREVCLSFTNKEGRTPLDLARLSIPPGISFLKVPRQWIKYSLVLAGAHYGIRRRDQLAANVAEVDKEKESKSIGKSAALVAVCAALILSTSLAAPFSVTNLYHNPRNDIKRAAVYNVFAMSDALAFAFSAASITCSTIAGLSFAGRRMRLSFLSFGAVTLCGAALFIIVVFTAGISVTIDPVAHLNRSLVYFLLVMAYPLILLLLLMISRSAVFHGRALILRLGFPAWVRAAVKLNMGLSVISVMIFTVIVSIGYVLFSQATQSARKMRDQAEAPISSF